MKKFNHVLKRIMIYVLFFNSLLFLGFLLFSLTLDVEIPEIETIELVDRNNVKFLSFSNGKKKSYIKLEELSDITISSFLSIEDKRFYSHTGLDFIRICKAAIVDILSQNTKEGASTITQQYARNLFLTTDKTWKRKIAEMLIALNIESKYSKEEILEGYLNSIYFDHGIYGIEDASMFYFHKHASELSLVESAALAAIPKGPSIYSPLNHPENNRSRRNLILNELEKDGVISEDAYEEAICEELVIYGKNDFNNDTSSPYFQDYILNELHQIPYLDDYLSKGCIVYTTIDLDYNAYCVNQVKERTFESSIQASSIAIDPHDGSILSMVGGNSYVESSFNRVISSKRSPGSTLKPFLYLAALENGFTLATTFKSEKSTFYVNKETYSPNNYLDIYPNTDVTMTYALATSDNIYAVKTHLFLGCEVLKKKLLDFGIKSKIEAIPSLALGGCEVSMYELSSAYQVLANEGIAKDVHGIEKITTLDGEVIYEHKESSKRLANSSDVYLLNDAMTSIFDPNVCVNIRPTGVSIKGKLTNQYAAKSGSTDFDYWMVGYSPDILVLTHVGYDDNQVIKSSAEKLISKYLFADMVNKYYEEKDFRWYQKPKDIIELDLSPISGFYPTFEEYHKNMAFKITNLPWFVNYISEE